MSLSNSLAMFVGVALAYILMIDVFTVLFRVTGFKYEKAHFQVISLLTNSGYTTRESELTMSTISRRKLAKFVMMFGYVFSVTVVTVIVNVVMSLNTQQAAMLWDSLVIMSIVFIAFMLFRKIPFTRDLFNDGVERLSRRFFYRGQENPIIVLDEFAKGVIAEVYIAKMPPDLEGKSLAQLRLNKQFDIHFIFVKRGKTVVEVAHGDLTLRVGDQALMFGSYQNIKHVFQFSKQDTRVDSTYMDDGFETMHEAMAMRKNDSTMSDDQ